MAKNADPIMESTEKKNHDEAKSSFLDFEPYCAWERGEESDTLAVHLHGFKKEQIKVEVNNHRILKIHGQRPIDDSDDNNNKQWTTRFNKQLNLPDNYDEKRISAKFLSGVLLITIRKRDQNQEIIREMDDNNNKNNPAAVANKKMGNCVIKRGAENCCGIDKESDSAKGVLTMAGKVAAVVLIIVVSGAYVHSYMNKKRPLM